MLSVNDLIAELEKHRGKEVYVGIEFINAINSIKGVEEDANFTEVIYIVTS